MPAVALAKAGFWFLAEESILQGIFIFIGGIDYIESLWTIKL